MDKILTIIVPTYNMEKYLDKCLSSLIVTDEVLMRQLEVLVVNDGSKDRSSEIAHGYADRYPDTYVVIDKENGNYGSCINAALPVAKGKYVKVLDADDWFDTESFRKYLSAIQGLNVDLLINDCSFITDRGDMIPAYTEDASIIPDKVFHFDRIARLKHFGNFQMHKLAYRTDIFKQMHYQQSEGVSYSDMEWVFLPMTLVNNVYYINIPLYYYLVGREGQTVDVKVASKRFRDIDIVTSKMISCWKCNQEDSLHKPYLEGRLLAHLVFLYSCHCVRGYYNREEFAIFDKKIKKNAPDLHCQIMSKSYSEDCRFKYIKYFFSGNLYFLEILEKDGLSAMISEILAASDCGMFRPIWLQKLINRVANLH